MKSTFVGKLAEGCLLGGLLLISSASLAQSQAPESRVVPGEYLVKFKQQVGGASQVSEKLMGKASMKASYPGMDLYHIQMKNTGTETVDIEALRNDPSVEFVEPNYVMDKAEVDVSEKMSEEEMISQAVVSAAASSYSQSSALTNTAQSWALEKPASQGAVVVAVVDTGLDSGHHVFKPFGAGGSGALWVNQLEAGGRAGVDDDNNGYVDDVNGWNFITNGNNFYDDDDHGTHVAGIIIGTGFNIFASPLTQSKIQIMPLKFLDANGSGSTSNAIRAIYYAVNNGAKVINNSWGGPTYSRSLHDAYAYAYAHAVVIATAAGNYGSNNDSTPMYPANIDVPSNITVASTGNLDYLSSFSNFGSTRVAVSAPGEGIVSTVPGDAYMQMWGTSMATPFIAGIAALALREAPNLTGYQIKQMLLATADPVSDLHGKISSEARVNSYNLIQSAKTSTAVAAYQPAYSVEASAVSLASMGAAPAAAKGAGCGLVMDAVKKGPGQGGDGSFPQGPIAIALLFAPLAGYYMARRKATGVNGRKHDRFKIQSEVRVMLGDKEIVGNLNSISMGGLSFNADEMLEKGGLVTLQVHSPDGKEQIMVTGEIVWSDANKAYGVQFAGAKQGATSMIADWTRGLLKI